jgi:methyl-accepting chemotaxis protein
MLVTTSEERTALEKFIASYKDYLIIQKKLLSLSEKNRNLQAKSVFLDESLSAYRTYSQTLLDLSELNSMEAQKASGYGDVLYESSLQTMLAILAVSALVSTLVAYFITKHIVSSISTIQSAMSRLSEGDLTYRLQHGGSNEVGDLSNSYNLTINKLGSLFTELVSVADNVANSSSLLASEVNQSYTNADNTLNKVEHSATSVAQMSTTSIEMSENASQAESAAREAMANVRSGNSALNQSTAISRRIGDSINESAHIVNELNEYTLKIDQVIEVINNISEQTNLLALNAAIEAARAGEQGRGFAVVADEVRALAAKTQSSTVNIQDIIGQLQNKAASASEAMQVNEKLIIESRNIGAEVENAFEGIARSVNAISDINSLVATASIEQSTVSEDLANNVSFAADMVSQNVSSMRESAEASRSLSSEAQRQKELLRYFKLFEEQ